MNDSNIERSSEQIHAEVTRLHDTYEAILALRDASKHDMELYRRLDHEQQAAFRAWLFAMQAATMYSDDSVYKGDMRMKE